MKKSNLLRNTAIVALCVTLVGFVVMMIGVGQGGNLVLSNVRIGPISTITINDDNRGEVTSFHVSPKNIQSLDIEADLGDIEIVKGDAFDVLMQGFTADEVHYDNLEHNVFKIETSYKGNLISVGSKNNHGKIKVTIPKDFKKVEVSAGLGNIIVSDLVLGEFDISVDVGNLEATNMDVASAEIDVNLGKAKYNGTIGQAIEVDCDLGQVELEIKGNKEEYALELETDLGSVTVDGQSHNQHESKGSTNKKIEASANLGEVKISFIH